VRLMLSGEKSVIPMITFTIIWSHSHDWGPGKHEIIDKIEKNYKYMWMFILQLAKRRISSNVLTKLESVIITGWNFLTSYGF
jgi:hypothetical protein